MAVPLADPPIDPSIPGVSVTDVPAVTAADMARIDRLATDVFAIDLLQMMELAGSQLAELARLELGGRLAGRRVIVAAGPGNNGAGGLAAARHLRNRGASVRIVLARPVNRSAPAGRHQLATLLQMAVDCGVAIYDVRDDELAAELEAADLIVDAVLGYRGTGEPRDEVGWLVRRITSARTPIVSLDLPSGIDADTGRAAGVAVTASATLTLALPKRGLLTRDGRSHAGRLYLADIGLPVGLYAHLGLTVREVFERGQIVRLEMMP